MPLDVDTYESFEKGSMVSDPNIITSKSVNLKVCAHSSGAVYLFSLRNLNKSKDDNDTSNPNTDIDSSCSTGKIKYSVNLLHHNKTLIVECDLKDSDITSLPLKIDVATFANG